MSSSNNTDIIKRSETTFDSQSLSRLKVKFLQTLPDLSEEDECHSHSTKLETTYTSVIPNAHSNVINEPSLPRPFPPPTKFDKEKALPNILPSLSLDFPMPPTQDDPEEVSPVKLTRSPATRVLPMRFRRHRHSPTSSTSSLSSSSTTSSSVTGSQIGTTPVTSDDDDMSLSIAVNPKRLSMIFTKSLTDLHDGLKYQLDSSNKIEEEEEEEEDDDDDDAAWIFQEMKDFVTLSGPLSADSHYNSAVARPESFLPPLRMSTRYSKFPYPSCGPNAQLDPAFPFSYRTRELNYTVPSHPPPPPPPPPKSESPQLTTSSSSTPSSNAVELTMPFRSLSINRPPPKSSIPLDIDELLQMDVSQFDFLEDELAGGWPDSPFSPYSDYHPSPTSSLEFDPRGSLPPSPSHSIPDSHVAGTYESNTLMDRRPSCGSSSSSASTQHLRSRWSSSTLSTMSIQQTPSSSSSWMSKFSLRTKKTRSPAAPSITPVTSPSKKQKDPKATKPVIRKLDLDERRITRRDSRSSRISSDSAESTSSTGLRRKPIPVEIFMKA